MSVSSFRPAQSRRTREEVTRDFAQLVAAVERTFTLVQHTSHMALRAETPADARHWLAQVETAQGLLVDATIDVTDGLEVLKALYPAAHDDAARPTGTAYAGFRCACGRWVDRCPARVQLRDGFTQWVDERGKLRDVSDAGTEAIPAGQR